MKLSSRLTIFIFSLNLGILSVGGFIFFRFSQQIVRDEFASRSQMVAESIEKDCRLYAKGSSLVDCVKNLEDIRQAHGVEYIRLANSNGDQLAAVGKVSKFDTTNLDSLKQMQRQTTVFPTFVAIADSDDELEVGFSFKALDDGLAKIMKMVVLWAVIQAFILGLAVFFFMRYLNRRLQPLIDGCRRVAGGDFDVHIEKGGTDEVGEVASAINRMGMMLKAFLAEHERNRQTNFARHKLASIGEMAGGMAHEINNPLAVIKGNSQLLMQMAEEDGSLPREIIDDRLTKLIAAAERISTVTRGLTVFFAQNRTESVENIEVAPVVKRTLEITSARAAMDNIKVTMDESGFGVFAMARDGDLLQVLVSLLNNAYEAVSKVEQKTVSVKVEARGSSVVIGIQDSGPGVSPELRSKLMQPFFTTKELGQGMGLGLWVSQGLLAEFNGKIELLEGSPTVVEVTLERASSRQQPKGSEDQKAS